ncbi:Sel1 domain protein repeat-containing protein [Seminavis robusta]|uniref:Sel1 domain protein repeat-containing protein n=1 Tax=Seminavis robusta TaxID=568900 RepID=A0A9N8HSC9_9STRA|nr:Sel1 domain protein repeat-containing protein [Seminavis robusta]|eukprot:Sro1154_g247120.1 Sel1 domain protein repeat-containing protein (233) ;mRNA; f:11691-12471
MESSKPKRKASLEEDQQPSNKCPKKSPTDDLICPITLELPWDPVIAEDGRVYERESIEEHIENKQGDLRSPITNGKMGSKLCPANWVHNHIDTLVEFGVIDGDLADKWNEKVKQKKEMEELLKKAEGGDARAMYDLGVNYQYGSDGFKKDPKAAFQWAMMYISMAAGQGSDWAAYELGMALADGLHGVIKDKAEAIRWLEEAVGDCRYKHLSLPAKNQARETLNELKAQTSD